MRKLYIVSLRVRRDVVLLIAHRTNDSNETQVAAQPMHTVLFGLAMETVDSPPNFSHGEKTKWWPLHVKR